ncbi:MAG TPA: hypothetical protein VGQ62_05750, partial [Chloroflexota bacterium]|nr:hypothetical protein [Chloroflexota bacterium]
MARPPDRRQAAHNAAADQADQPGDPAEPPQPPAPPASTRQPAPSPGPRPRAATDRRSSQRDALSSLVPLLDRWQSVLEFATCGLALAAMLALFIINRTLPRYVDEADNLLGGELIAHGYRLYGDFFSHHMPLPYYVMAAANLVGANSLTAYRLFFSILITAVFGMAMFSFRKRLPVLFLAGLVFTIGLVHPIFLGYMVLADHLFAFALVILLLFLLAHGDVSFT